jgi:hypothetical protein
MKSRISMCWLVVIMTLGFAAEMWAQEETPPQEPAAVEQAAAAEVPAAEGAAATEPAAAPAPPGTEFATTVDFSLTGPIALSGVVGEVEIRSIEFVRANAKTGMIKGAFSSNNDDLKSDITIRLSCATEAVKKWKLDVMVEFLDGEGNVIDRATNSISIKSEAKIFDFKLTTLAWVVPHIKQVKLSISGKQ